MMKRQIAVVGVVALGAGVVGGVVGAAVDGNGDSTATTAPPIIQATPTAARSTKALTAEQIYRQNAPGVVVITDTQTQSLPSVLGPQNQRVQVLGSGFVIDTQGDIVTNAHVVQGSTDVRVGFSGGATYPAKVIGTDPSTDLAVIRVDAPATALHPLQFASSRNVQPGDTVYAIGNPFGLDRTLTAGVVSATGRSIQALNGLSISGAIQTDAAINHGNSGGPLIDTLGGVIGVNSQIETGGTSQGNVGVGFAIPSETTQSVVAQLIATGHAEHAWLGVEVETIDSPLARAVSGLPEHGVLVAGVVPGSPAAKAGLVAGSKQITVAGETAVVGGDAIVAVDGTPVSTAAQLEGIVAGHRPGDQIQLQVSRKGSTRMVDVTLGNAPTTAPTTG